MVDTSYSGKHNRPRSSEATMMSAPRETGPPGPAANEEQDPETGEQHNLLDSLEGRKLPRVVTTSGGICRDTVGDDDLSRASGKTSGTDGASGSSRESPQ